MNIAMINGPLAAAGGSNQVSGLANFTGTSGDIDFAALLKAAGKGQSFGSAEFSAELQALFANAGAGQFETLLHTNAADARTNAKGFDLAALLSAGAKRSENAGAADGQEIAMNEPSKPPHLLAETALHSPPPTEALLAAIAQALARQKIAANEPGKDLQLATETVLQSSLPSEALAAAIAQALAGQSTLPISETRPGEQRLAEATTEGDSSLSAVADMAMTAMISPAVIPGSTIKPEPTAENAFSGSLSTKSQGENSPPASSNRPLFSVDRISSQSSNVLTIGNPSNNPLPAGTDSDSFASSLAEAANTAAAPIGNAGMAATAASAHRTHEAPATPSPIASPLHDRNIWTQDFGDRIVWMAKQDQQSADIRITPANLGPVQISLNIEDGKASAVFASPHAEVRQAIEEALPRLREMLNSAGISLEQANVGSQMPQQQSDNTARFAAAHRSTGENAILPGDEGRSVQTAVTPLNRGRGLVDLFA